MLLKENQKSHLVIISLAFYRIAKVSLSDLVLQTLGEKSDILIVSPFAEEPTFKRNFGGENIFFLKWDKQFSKYKVMLLGVSEIMRRCGYWRRFKNKGMIYYLKNQYTKFGPDGKDTKLNPIMCVLYWLLSNIGKFRRAWLISEKIINSKNWYQFPGLVTFSKKYKNVTLIQSANWGLQERALARLSMEQNWRKVLLPYTTDQLLTNGYLLNNFDAVCIQGSFEFNQALNYHLIPEEQIYKLGSCWFRVLERVNSLVKLREEPEPSVIMYAGISNLYYCSQDEFDAVDAIIDFISHSNKKYKLIYRPVVCGDKLLKQEIIRKYEGAAELQWPTNADLSISELLEGCSQKEALYEYAIGLANCNLLVMSSTVSLCLDAAFLGKCGIIANMIDNFGILKKRYNYLYSMDLLLGARVISSIPELLDNMEDLLNNPDKASKEAAKLISVWDYPGVDFQDILCKAVYGN